MKFESKGLISLDINGSIYDYKLYQSLESLSRTKSQRKSAKELKIGDEVTISFYDGKRKADIKE